MHELLIIDKLVLSINKLEIIHTIFFLHKDLLKEQNRQKTQIQSLSTHPRACMERWVKFLSPQNWNFAAKQHCSYLLYKLKELGTKKHLK